jgi:hypothetical protein
LSKQIKKAGWVSSLISFFKRMDAGRMSSLVSFFKRVDAALHELTVVLVSIMLTVTKIIIFVQWLTHLS